jgi:hypothetical protein
MEPAPRPTRFYRHSYIFFLVGSYFCWFARCVQILQAMYWHLGSPRWPETSCHVVAWQRTSKVGRRLVGGACRLVAGVENRQARLKRAGWVGNEAWLDKGAASAVRIGGRDLRSAGPRWPATSLVYWQSGRHIYKGERGCSEITRVEQGRIRPLFQLKWDAFCQAAILRVVFCFLFFIYFFLLRTCTDHFRGVSTSECKSGGSQVEWPPAVAARSGGVGIHNNPRQFTRITFTLIAITVLPIKTWPSSYWPTTVKQRTLRLKYAILRAVIISTAHKN